MIWRAMARIKIDNNEWTWTRLYSFLGKFVELEEKKRFHFDFSLQVEYFLQPVMLF